MLVTGKFQFRSLFVRRLSRYGKWCYFWKLGGYGYFTVRRLILTSCTSGTHPSRFLRLVELIRIKRSINSVRAVICACGGSRLAFIFSSTNSEENLVLFSSLPSNIPVSTSPVVSSSCAEVSGCVLESYEFPLFNVLNL